MPELYDPSRHEPLSGARWSARAARAGITDICRDAETAFVASRLWPLHPGDREGDRTGDGLTRGIYLGAAGMVHGLARIARAGLYEPRLDLTAIASGLRGSSPDSPGAENSLLLGSSGMLVVAHRLDPAPGTANALAAAIAANAAHPANELLYGAPGTMLAARAMYERTGDQRFAELWRASARTLLGRQEPDGLWTQQIGSDHLRFVGAGHGFAGNIHALLSSPQWLEDSATLTTRALATIRALALIDGPLASWATLPTGSRYGFAPRVQWCHGAPGIVTSLAPLAPGDERHTALLAAGGELTWRAGPSALNVGLCHGTAGNGFAFLALHSRTGDERWLARARAFAMHALAQVTRLRAATGRARYTLFTGDIGAALLAAACVEPDPRFPGLDDL